MTIAADRRFHPPSRNGLDLRPEYGSPDEYCQGAASPQYFEYEGYLLRGTPWEPSVIKNSSLAILLVGLVLFVERAFL
jgi:hypothetical protein